MQEMSEHDRPLSAERAFVVQLHAEADVGRGRIIGRAVHVVSGQARHFDSLETLLMFIDQVLMRLHAEPPTEPPVEP
jgi:hypothetical protein